MSASRTLQRKLVRPEASDTARRPGRKGKPFAAISDMQWTGRLLTMAHPTKGPRSRSMPESHYTGALQAGGRPALERLRAGFVDLMMYGTRRRT